MLRAESSPCTDEMLTMLPPPAFSITGTACFAARKWDLIPIWNA